MNIFSNAVTAPENDTTNSNIIIIIIIIIIINGSVWLAEINVFDSTVWPKLGLPWRRWRPDKEVAVNIRNKHVVNCSLLDGRDGNS
jgi:hypothetical protein